jgi:hypothetical protein
MHLAFGAHGAEGQNYFSQTTFLGRRVVLLAPARLREYTSTWIVAIAIVSKCTQSSVPPDEPPYSKRQQVPNLIELYELCAPRQPYSRLAPKNFCTTFGDEQTPQLESICNSHHLHRFRAWNGE